MKIAVFKETMPGETRVAATPETVKKLIALGHELRVETGAGAGAALLDAAYAEEGATICPSAADAAQEADLVLKVQRPSMDELRVLGRGAKVAAIMSPFNAPDSLEAYARLGIDAYAMDLMPRITRAQSMDVLSSQSNLAGYKAVIDSAAYFGRAFPMMMTAAGTVAPAKVFVMGAGVAGLQAIATARRLGAVVTATDVRLAAKEQVESLGASFVTVDEDAMRDAETSGGYAKEMSDDFKARQAEFVAEHLKKQDIVITTALIPGRPAPELISEQMVRSMAPGSVIFDMAAEQGGNVALTQPGEAIEIGGVTILGFNNVAGRLAADASALYARNLLNFLSAFKGEGDGELVFDPSDEIIAGIALTRDGAIVHPSFAPESAPEAVSAEVVDDAAPNDVSNDAPAEVVDVPAQEANSEKSADS